MKKPILWTISCLAVALPLAAWAGKLTGGLPPSAHLHDAARGLALAGAVLLVIQYGLSSGFHWLERGIGLDRLLRCHRRLGVAIVGVILLHPILLILSERLQGYSSPTDLPKILGLLGLTATLGAAGAAMAYGTVIRKYEIWKNLHRAAYGAFPLIFVHSLLLGSDLKEGLLPVYWWLLALAYGAIVLGKTARRIQIARAPYEVSSVTQESHDSWTLQFAGPPFPYLPGQFMILQLVRAGRRTSSHPFTLSSSPSADTISITAKSVGDFTSTLKQARVSDRAFIDAPFGTFSFLNHDAPALVFIAGGIGITPFMSMLRYLRDNEPGKEVLLLWGNKTEEDILFRGELEHMTKAMPSLKAVHVISRQKSWTGEKGHVDAGLIQRYLSRIERREFFVCGPPAFMTSVTASLKGLGVSGARIHCERFAL